MKSLAVEIFQNKDEWIAAAIASITENIAPDQPFCWAFSGGKTPVPVYEALALQKNILWENLFLFQTDERYISPDNAESNQQLIYEHFLKIANIPPNLISFFNTGEKLSWEESAEEYSLLLSEFGKPFDGCILGIGPDGHIASLFPNGPELLVNDKLAVVSETSTFAVWKRLTLTFPVILQSRKIVVLLRGAEKKLVLDELRNGEKDWQEFPAKKLLDHPNLHIFFLEEDVDDAELS